MRSHSLDEAMGDLLLAQGILLKMIQEEEKWMKENDTEHNKNVA